MSGYTEMKTRRMQAGRMCLRIFSVHNSESEFHRERKRTTQNYLRMGIATMQTMGQEEDFSQQSCDYTDRKNTEKLK